MKQQKQKEQWKTDCILFSSLLSDSDVSITPQLTSCEIHQGNATVILLGVGWHTEGANFPSVKSCNYANAAGCPKALTTSRSRRQSQPFMSSSAGSEARHPGSSCHCMVTRTRGGRSAFQKHNSMKHHLGDAQAGGERPCLWNCPVPFSDHLSAIKQP